MAVIDYVKSIAATDSVSKEQIFRFLEMQFARADRNHDGQLGYEELQTFMRSITQPDSTR